MESQIKKEIDDFEIILKEYEEKQSANDTTQPVQKIEPSSLEDCGIGELRESQKRIQTGFASIDELFQEYVFTKDCKGIRTGFRLQDIILIGGMSGLGKTSFAFNVFCRMYEAGIKVGFLSLDMGKERTWDSFRKALVGYASLDVFLDAMQCAGNPFIFTERTIITTLVLKNYIKACKLEVVFIDYIDKLESVRKGRTTQENYKHLCNELKSIVAECNCSIILLTQANLYEARQGKPTIMNIYGGKEMRSEVDHILAVYRASKYLDKLPEKYHNVTEIIGLKLRRDDDKNSKNYTTAYLRLVDSRFVELSDSEIEDYTECKASL